MYDKACYQRRKRGAIKKSCSEACVAYKEIKDKWGFDDITIHSLLTDYTKTEILNGSYEGCIFKPKSIYFLSLI